MDKQKNKSLSSSNSEGGNTAQSEDRRISLNLSRRSFGAKPNVAATNSKEAEAKAPLAPQPSADKKSDDSQLNSKNQSTSQEPKPVPTALSSAPQTESSPSKLQFSTAGKRQLNLRANAFSLDSSNAASSGESKSAANNTSAIASKDTKQAAPQPAKKNKAAAGSHKESSKGSKVPPWMAQYQAKAEENGADESGVHLDLTSKTKQEQLEQEKAEKERQENSAQAAKIAEQQKHLEQKQEQRLKSIKEYQGFNSFDLDLLSFQKSFDSIDQKLSSLLDEHYDHLEHLMALGLVPGYERLELGTEAVDLFTSKKSKYKRKSVLPTEALQKEIIDYLHFKHRGVFKAVCLYQFFCEQFRVELFSQLEKQCRAYTSTSNEVAMGDLQRMLDEIEPLDVAANKLLRFSLSEGKKILATMQAFGRKADTEICQEKMLDDDKHPGNDYRASEFSLINKTSVVEKTILEESKSFEVFKSKFFSPTEADILERVSDFTDDDLVSYISDALVDKLAPNARDVLKEQGDEELNKLFPFLRCHLANPNSIPDDSYVILNDQLRRLHMALTYFDGYFEPQTVGSTDVLDDCMLNTGFDWITSEYLKSLTTNKFEDWTCNIEWVFYWRLLNFLSTSERETFFINPDNCVVADSDYIFPCAETNFKRNLSQLNLLTRQLNGIRQIVALSKGYGNKRMSFHADEHVNFTDNTSAVALQFIFSLGDLELKIFEEVLNKLSKCGEEEKLVLTVDDIVKLLVEKHGVEDSHDTSIAVIDMCLKLLNSVLFEPAVSLISVPNLMISHEFRFEVYASQMLVKNLESIKRMIKMRQSLKSIDSHMNRELLYLNPALRCLFECCESTSATRNNSGNILLRLDEFIKYEYYYNKLRNVYLDEVNEITNKIDKDVYLSCLQSMPGEFKQCVDLELFEAYLDDIG